MPTGYTADVTKDTTLKDFVMTCSRAMGALLPMRDLPSAAPIPERFEPSPYHKNKLAELEELHRAYNERTAHDWEVAAAAAYLAAETDRAQRLIDIHSRIAGYRAMTAKVQAWTPPTPDHVGLKDFMLSQLRDSIQFDDHSAHYAEPTAKLTGEQYKTDTLAKLAKDISYHSAEWDKEVERTEGRNRWLAQLRDSLSDKEQ